MHIGKLHEAQSTASERTIYSEAHIATLLEKTANRKPLIERQMFA